MAEVEKIGLSREEANALIKSILYLKFECTDTDSLLYASSPLMNSIIDKVTSMYGYKADWDNVFSKTAESKRNFALDKINRSELEDGESLDKETLNEILIQYLYPYKNNI